MIIGKDPSQSLIFIYYIYIYYLLFIFIYYLRNYYKLLWTFKETIKMMCHALKLVSFWRDYVYNLYISIGTIYVMLYFLIIPTRQLLYHHLSPPTFPNLWIWEERSSIQQIQSQNPNEWVSQIPILPILLASSLSNSKSFSKLVLLIIKLLPLYRDQNSIKIQLYKNLGGFDLVSFQKP